MRSTSSFRRFPNVARERFQYPSDWRWPSLILSVKVLFRRLSPPGDRWCDMLGFVPACSVPNSSTLQICPLWDMIKDFWLNSDGCFSRQCTCSVISLHSGMANELHPHEYLKADVDQRRSSEKETHWDMVYCEGRRPIHKERRRNIFLFCL